MSYANFDIFVDEVKVENNEEIAPKGFELYGEQFDLVDQLPAMAILEYTRTVKYEPLIAIANLLEQMLDDNQYPRFRDLAIKHKLDAVQLFALIQRIFSIYEPRQDIEKKVVRGKRK